MNLMKNQSGEAVLALMAMLVVISLGSAHEIRKQERVHAEKVHHLKYHKDELKKEKDLEHELKKAKRYRVWNI